MNPFTELQRLFERMSEQYDESAEAWTFDQPFGELALGAESMAIDVVERDDAYVVVMDLPGFERDDVDIQVTDTRLRVDAERETTVAEEGDRYVHREREEQSAERSIELPEPVRVDDVTAMMEHGVLTVRLPREEVEEAQEIEIE